MLHRAREAILLGRFPKTLSTKFENMIFTSVMLMQIYDGNQVKSHETLKITP